MGNKLDKTTSKLAQTTRNLTKLIILNFPGEELVLYMLIDGYKLVPSSEGKKERKRRKPKQRTPANPA